MTSFFGIRAIFSPRPSTAPAICTQRSSSEASDRSAAVASTFDMLPALVGCADESRQTPSPPVYEELNARL
jgi:hypothetical protein